jgi:hypothetical protein
VRRIRLKNQQLPNFSHCTINCQPFAVECSDGRQWHLPAGAAINFLRLIFKGYFRASDLARRL